MSTLWRSFVPYHVARDLIRQPGQSPVGQEQRFDAVVLFADVSGFTALSEALGAAGRDGTEELTTILNRYFEQMIALIQSYGGITAKFGGDALTVLFPYTIEDHQAVARRALQCALEMQGRMPGYTNLPTSAGLFSLTMKAGLAQGPIFCTTVGDPALRLEAVIAGGPLDACAEAEHHARAGEVLAASSLLETAAPVTTGEERQGFGVVLALPLHPVPHPLPGLPAFPPQAAQMAAAYIHPSIAARLVDGQASFINEHRKVTVLFIQFENFDYDGDPLVGQRLQDYLLQVIQTIEAYDGYLNKVDTGDKGSKVIALFGAPIAHENDAERALRCALDLCALPERRVRIGVNTGFVFCGQVGSDLRREYTVMGDAVNLSARLMQAAAFSPADPPGQVLVGDSTFHNAGRAFAWLESLPLKVKGKAEPVTVHPLAGLQSKEDTLQELNYSLPMVGRQAEVAAISEKLDLALHGQGQIVGITAEAGMGKSRLAAEIIHLALEAGLRGCGGECLSHGANTPYLVWRSLLANLFGLDMNWPLETQVQRLRSELTAIDPALLPRLPLLGAALNLPIPENELTRSLDAQLRKTSLEYLVAACLRYYSQQTPMLLVLEDCHWIDPLSNDLLEAVGRSTADLPILMLVVYRPPEANREHPAVARFGNFTEIRLSEFTPAEAQRLVALKLEQLFGDASNGLGAGQSVPAEFVERLTERAGGNPFYIDEMVNLIHDRGLNLADPRTLASFELPDSLHSLIISRIDRLPEAPKSTLKVASVIGRSFRSSWVRGVYPSLGTLKQIKGHLSELSRLEITPLDKVEPELEYIFKHIVTREVAYASLALATRTMLHGALGQFIEHTYPEELGRYLDLLAHHYSLSESADKQREYYRKAGDAARHAYANESAVDYYQRLLPLLDGAERSQAMLDLGEVWQITGQWGEANDICQAALNLAQAAQDQSTTARCQYALGRIARLQGDYPAALKWLELARQAYQDRAEYQGLSETMREIGIIYWSQGSYSQALERFEKVLQLKDGLKDQSVVYQAMSNIGLVHWYQGEYAQALQWFEQALALSSQAGDRLRSSMIVSNMGNVYLEQGRYAQAFGCYIQTLRIAQELGNRLGICAAVGNLGNVYWQQGEYANALQCHIYNLYLGLELGDRLGITGALWGIAETFKQRDQYPEAMEIITRAVTLGRALETPFELSDYLNSQADLLFKMGDLAASQTANNEALKLAQETANQIVQAQAGLRSVSLRLRTGETDLPTAIHALEEMLPTAEGETDQAAIHYEIWRLAPTQEAHHRQAAEAYRTLYEHTPNVEYKWRYETLSGERLPPPPSLPPLPPIVTQETVSLEALAAQVDALSKK